MTSAFDEPREVPQQQAEEGPASSPVKARYPTQSAKLSNLSSNIHGLQGADANQFYHKKENSGQVVDIVLSGMKPNMDEAAVKRIAGVKHVISANVDLDNLKGTCTGTGRIKIRLNEGEDPEQIRQRYVNQGVLVKDFKNQP